MDRLRARAGCVLIMAREDEEKIDAGKRIDWTVNG
jgi:hypothetical protein